MPISPIARDVPLPKVTDDNYFVANVYLCLLPDAFVHTDINLLESMQAQEVDQQLEAEYTSVTAN